MEYPSVSVIVCTNKDGIANGMEACLNSLRGLSYPEDLVEYIVVNDGSTEQTKQLVADNIPVFSRASLKLTQIINEPNRGLYASKQRAMQEKKHSSQVVAVTDDDCEVDPSWLTLLVPHYQDPRVGSVGGRIDSKNDKTVLERFAADPWNQVLCNPENARFFHGANCSYRRAALESIGGFNPKLTSGGDAEVSFRLREAGWKLMYEPDAVVYHQHRTTLKGFWQQFKKYGHGDYYLLQKFNDARFTSGGMFWGDFMQA